MIQIKGIFIAILIVIVSMVIISFTPVNYINYIYLHSHLFSVFNLSNFFMTKKMRNTAMNFPHLVEQIPARSDFNGKVGGHQRLSKRIHLLNIFFYLYLHL